MEIFCDTYYHVLVISPGQLIMNLITQTINALRAIAC